MDPTTRKTGLLRVGLYRGPTRLSVASVSFLGSANGWNWLFIDTRQPAPPFSVYPRELFTIEQAVGSWLCAIHVK